MKNPIIVVGVLFITVLLSSCSTYVGQPVNMNHPSVCKCVELPKECSAGGDGVLITYTISKSGSRYLLNGTAEYNGANWTEFSNARFELLLIKDGVITESLITLGGQGSLERGVRFKKFFTPKEPFDATLLGFNMDVQG